MTKELILYTPHPAQLALHQSTARFKVFCAGRQVGKSTACLNELAFKAWEKPYTHYWFVSPTFSQAKDQFRRLNHLLPREIFEKTNETELRCEIINHSVIEFKSGEARDNLRGATLDGVIMDEVRDQHPDTWPMLLRPMLTTTKGWAIFPSTPSGFDHFYDLGQNEKTDKDWQTFHAPSTANPLFTKEEFEAAKRSMSEAQFAQEIMAEFRDITAGKAYVSFGEHNRATESPFATGRPWSPYLPLIIGMDFNLNPMHYTIGQTTKEQWHWFDEVHLKNSHTQEAGMVLRDKILRYKHEGHRSGETEVILCGDATGKATQRSSNQSDYDVIKAILKDAGIKFFDQTPEANPSIKDRVNAVNVKCRNASGAVEMWVNFETCRMLVHDLQRVTWKPGADLMLDPGSKRELTHASDSIGYPIAKLTPIRGVREIGRTRIINRVL